MPVEERVDVLEQRANGLETIFGQFMAQTGAAMLRMDRRAAEDRQEYERHRQAERQESEKNRQADRQEWEKSLEAQRQAERQESEKNRQAERQEWEKSLEAQRQERERSLEAQRQEWEKDRKARQREWNKKWGDLANRLGTIVEDIVAPNMPRIAKHYFGLTEIEDFMVRRQVRNKRDRSKRREFDVIVVGQDKVILNETKATPRIEYIDEFLKVLPELEDYFPEYRGKTIIPVFASLHLGKEFVNYLTKHKVYAMGMGEETMTLLNFDKIEATE